MLLGTNKQDITPKDPIALAGFAHRAGLGKASEVHEPIYVKSFFLKSEEDLFLLLVADFIWWDNTYVEELKLEIENQFDIPQDQVCFHATHSHSGPQTSFRFSKQLGEPSKEYLDFLTDQVLHSVDIATTDTENVRLRIHKGKGDIAVYRRKKIDGVMLNAPNTSVPIDDDLTVISFISDQQVEKAIWIHYTCHPTCTGANIISGEYPGTTCKIVEEAYPNSNVAFLQGFSGDVRPALVKDGYFYSGTIDDMTKMGAKLADDVLDVLNGEGAAIKTEPFAFETVRVPLSFSGDNVEKNVPEALEEEWPALVKNINGDYTLSIQYVKISEDLALLCCNAEMVQAYGQFIKQIDNRILPLGYSNGMVGYVSTEKQLKEGGYEPIESLYYFGYPTTLAASTEDTIQQNIRKVLT